MFIMEEHHEAFFAWNYAIQKGWISSLDNCLFHVDEHSDMNIPQFRESILELNGDLEKIKNFTYRELNIATFIIPACYCNILNQVYWIRQKHPQIKQEPFKRFVRSYNQSGKKLISGKAKDSSVNVTDVDTKYFDYFLSTIDELPGNKKVILDIDLDFFSCIATPSVEQDICIEITENEYNNFLNNPYNLLHYVGLTNIEAIQLKKRFYYVINNFHEIYPSHLKVEKEVIKERICRFINFLKENNIQPNLIDICRSRHSGYTPADQWAFIEEELVKGLKQIYSIELNSIIGE